MSNTPQFEAWKSGVLKNHPLASFKDHNYEDETGSWCNAEVGETTVGFFEYQLQTGEYEDPLDADEKFQAVMDKKGYHHFEGDSGLARLGEVCEDILGYKGHQFRHGDPLSHFLSDNPGAQQAIIEWIAENAKCYQEAIDGAYEQEFSSEEESVD